MFAPQDNSLSQSVERVRVDLQQLCVGLPLKYDLQTLKGVLLAKSGVVVTADLKRQWLEAGALFAEAIIRGSDQEEDESSFATAPHDPQIIGRLEVTIEQATDYVMGTAQKIARGEHASTNEIKSLLTGLRSDIQTDTASVLMGFAKSMANEISDNDLLVAQRSTQLSVIAMLLANRLGFSEEDLQASAIAGLFHDVSLMDCLSESAGRYAETSFVNHPMLSCSLFESAMRNDPKAAVAISQVHEQIDGTGFPKQLRLGRITPIARVLNVADAYLTLVSTCHPSRFPACCSFHPADAIGYLMFHSARGRFDRRVVRALIDVTSLYPVGCRVELNDRSIARVIRSSADQPSKPVVQIEMGTYPIVDLGQTKLSVARPTLSPIDPYRRLAKSKIGEVYWR